MESLPIIEKASITLRDRLREETATIHQSLHRNTGLHRLTHLDCSRSLYIEVLSIFFHFYRGLEEYFAPVTRRFMHEAKPLSWLEKDFLIMNHITPPESLSFGANLTNNVMLPPCIETYIGYLYVKQGSTLGGQTISKHLKKSLSLEPGVTQFFFAGFGDQTAHHWKAFLNYIAQHEASLDTDLVVKSAQTYFEILGQLFNQYFSPGDINE
ncbi:MAG: hypothetical protein B0W54_16570 [Cellvibrio sp. 79]|nr:MAG: hypothetical protein B0W54_16570 [Cellvibrio sp. 79]